MPCRVDPTPLARLGGDGWTQKSCTPGLWTLRRAFLADPGKPATGARSATGLNERLVSQQAMEHRHPPRQLTQDGPKSKCERRRQNRHVFGFTAIAGEPSLFSSTGAHQGAIRRVWPQTAGRSPAEPVSQRQLGGGFSAPLKHGEHSPCTL